MVARSVPSYWLDANIFLEASNKYYAFDFVPQFWEFLDDQVKLQNVSCPRIVYSELERHGNDDLIRWIKARRDTALFTNFNRFVQNRHREIATYVSQEYDQKYAQVFLGGADPWLIAHARQSGGRVVTFEKLEPYAKRVKIPNVCAHYNVECVDLFSMLRSRGFSVK
jgi:hypothetical protein